MLFEEIAEIVFVFKAAGVGNLLDHQIGVGEQALCLLQAHGCHVVRGGDSGDRLEAAQKLNVRESALGGNSGELNVLEMATAVDLRDRVLNDLVTGSVFAVFHGVLGDQIQEQVVSVFKIVAEHLGVKPIQKSKGGCQSGSVQKDHVIAVKGRGKRSVSEQIHGYGGGDVAVIKHALAEQKALVLLNLKDLSAKLNAKFALLDKRKNIVRADEIFHMKFLSVNQQRRYQLYLHKRSPMRFKGCFYYKRSSLVCQVL